MEIVYSDQALIDIKYWKKSGNFQVQTGNNSFGANGINGGLLYDLTDEYEAFERGAFFGGLKLLKSEIDTIYGARGCHLDILV